MSASMATTCFPCIARAALKLAVAVVLPTPPFPDVIVMTVPLILSPMARPQSGRPAQKQPLAQYHSSASDPARYQVSGQYAD